MSVLQKGFLSENRIMSDMVILDYEELAKASAACKALKLKVGLTQGSFDGKHVGHDRYLMKARETCDVLFVGIDSDEKIQKRKRRTSLVSQDERLEQLCHIRYVNVVTLKETKYPRHALQKAVMPDVIVISTQTKKGQDAPEYSKEEVEELKKFCGEVLILPPQAETSTTARIRTLMLDFKAHLKEGITKEIPGFVERIAEDFFSPKKD